MKGKILTTHSGAKGSNVLNAKNFYIFKLNALVFQESKGKYTMSLRIRYMKNVDLIKGNNIVTFKHMKKGYTYW